VLLGRDNEVKEIDSYINGTEENANVLSLVGFPGSGKSSLMAYSAKEHSKDSAFKVRYIVHDTTTVHL
jgi:DNA replication protein DnaC